MQKAAQARNPKPLDCRLNEPRSLCAYREPDQRQRQLQKRPPNDAKQKRPKATQGAEGGEGGGVAVRLAKKKKRKITAECESECEIKIHNYVYAGN